LRRGRGEGPGAQAGHGELILESEARSLRAAAVPPGLHLIQQIRDEAHRFAIVGHRARRGKARTTSMLNEIPGIGAKRRQALLSAFRRIARRAGRGVDDIAKVEGISRPLAERIYSHLHESRPVILSPRTSSRVRGSSCFPISRHLLLPMAGCGREDIAATAVFIFSGITDWLDGYLARRLKPDSAFGASSTRWPTS
jgi:hypothetical protein